MASCEWVWDVMRARAYDHVDNRSRTDNFLLPGELVTVVEETDAGGKPRRLSKFGVAP